MYNSLSTAPKALYNIIVYLAQSTAPEAENLWRLLKYREYDALSQPYLTFDEKMSLIWLKGKQDDYQVFFTSLVEDVIAEEKCILKIYNFMAQPESIYVSSVLYAFDFLFGGKMAMVEYDGVPCNRGDLFIHFILSVLNGVEIGGLGKFMFSDDLSRYSGTKTVVGNSETFTGVCLYMGTLMGDTGTIEDSCND